MIFNLAKTGLRRIFRGWQVEAMELLWEHQKPMKSGEMHSYLEKKDVRSVRGRHGTISRASVINFLNSLENDGILTYTENTGKGGYHKIYSLTEEAKTKNEFLCYIHEKVIVALNAFQVDK